MSNADELLKYKQLLESGAITQEEFDTAKRKILYSDAEKEEKQPEKKVNQSNGSFENNIYSVPNTVGQEKGTVKRTRKGMKVFGNICAVFAVIYLLMSISLGGFMIGMAAFFGILAFMFFKLSKIPKTYKHIGRDDTGMQKKKFVIMCVVVGYVIIGISLAAGNSNINSTDVATEQSKEKETKKDSPSIELANDFETTLYYAVEDNGGKVSSIYLEEASDLNNQTNTEYVEFDCKNKEEVVQKILNQLVEAQKSDTSSAVCAIIKDADEDTTSYLIIADIDIEGNLQMTYESPNYKSAKNQWIQGLFSAWDGSCTRLTKLIKQNLNDEKSYEHIETQYKIIKDETTKNEINDILSSAGYSSTVDIGDVFISTQFSAKNGFGGVVKNTAYGIASYNNNSITLIGIV